MSTVATAPTDDSLATELEIREAEKTLMEAEEHAKSVLKEEEARLKAEAEREERVKKAREVLARARKTAENTDEKLASAKRKILGHASAAAAVGVIPAAGFDLAAIAAIQLKLIAGLAKNFGVPFSEDWGKSTIAALVGSFGSGMAVTPVAASMIKMVPFVGWVAGSAALPTVAFGSTYALGKVFAAHFASGGNLLDFDIAKARESYQNYYKNAPAA